VDCRDLAPAVVDPPLLLIRRLFAIEDQARDLSPQERLELRQERSVPILAELEAKLPLWRQQVVPKHPVAGAINYILNQWKR
jgi:transposase